MEQRILIARAMVVAIAAARVLVDQSPSRAASETARDGVKTAEDR
jgi:hypothetical protein